jgi:ABC-type lipoprotein export system ATPase subunit
VIIANGLSKYYITSGREVCAVHEITLEFRKGEYYVIAGPDGSGKSTLLGMLAGLIKPTKGTVMLNGQDIWSLSKSELTRLRGRDISFIYPFPGLLPTLTIFENVVFPSVLTGKMINIDQRAERLIRKVGLSAKAEAYPESLSRGDATKAAIARALINDPQIIFADEPTEDLDTGMATEILDILEQVHQEGKTIIMTTRNEALIRSGWQVFFINNHCLKERIV